MMQAALSLAGAGLAVFPLKPNEKVPLIKGWQDSATTDPEQIRRWWGEWPDANIGIPTGEKTGVVVIDVDGPEGVDSLHRLEAELGPLPRGAVVKTGSGGFHLYFAADAEVGIRNSASKIAEKIDVRGDGGYVVAPPSIHPNGKTYEWIACDAPVEV